MDSNARVETVFQLSRLFIRVPSVGATSVYFASDEQFAEWVEMVRAHLPSLPIPTQPWTALRRLEFIQLCQERGMRFALVEPSARAQELIASIVARAQGAG